MTANLRLHVTSNVSAHQSPRLYLALELGWDSWKVAFTAGVGQPPRLRQVPGRDWMTLLREIAAAKRKLHLPADCPVLSCYEAGRDGFWLHRCLTAHGVENLVVDSASIEVNRRQRRAKNDRLDVGKLLSMLLRYSGGERSVWSVVQIPTPEEEDARQLHRELQTLKCEVTESINRIKGLLASCGLAVEKVDRHFPKLLAGLRQWDGRPVLPGLRDRLLREFEGMQTLNRQIRQLYRQRNQELRKGAAPALEQIRKLLGLRGIGVNAAWLFVQEFFGWRKFQNRRQVGSLAGLAPTPYSSGQLDHEQGISKAGNKRIRWMAVEIAWLWLHFQPHSELSRWFMQRFGTGNSRQRKIGIVALARKLLVQLWKYLETDVAPAGAELVDWRSKAKSVVCSLDTA